MRKGKAFRKLSRTPKHKWAMLRNMANSLVEHERIVTTVPKAKELRHMAEHLITLAKRGEIHHRQQANALLRTRPALTKLFDVLGPRYKERQGGYTRILKLSKPRAGDKAPMAVMEYVDRPGELRAARPPASRQMDVLADVLRSVSITPLNDMSDEEVTLAMKQQKQEESEEDKEKEKEKEMEEEQVQEVKEDEKAKETSAEEKEDVEQPKK